MAQRKLGRTRRADRKSGIMRKACARPECQPEPYLQLKEGDRAMLKLRADDSLSRQTEPIPIKPQRSFQIVNTESNDRDSRLHIRTSAPFWHTKGKKFETGYVLEGKVSTFRGGPPRAAKLGSHYFAVSLGIPFKASSIISLGRLVNHVLDRFSTFAVLVGSFCTSVAHSLIPLRKASLKSLTWILMASDIFACFAISSSDAAIPEPQA